MTRARDMANLGPQAGSGLDASDITTGTLGNTVQDNITRLGTIGTGTWEGTTIAVAQGGTGVTADTGSGNVVKQTSPTLVTPTLGTIQTSGTTFPQYHKMASGFGIQYYTGYFNSASTLTFDFPVFDSNTAGNLFYFIAGCTHYALASYASYRAGYGFERSGTMNVTYEGENATNMGTFSIGMTSATNVRVTKSANNNYMGHGFVMIMGRYANV